MGGAAEVVFADMDHDGASQNASRSMQSDHGIGLLRLGDALGVGHDVSEISDVADLAIRRSVLNLFRKRRLVIASSSKSKLLTLSGL